MQRIKGIESVGILAIGNPSCIHFTTINNDIGTCQKCGRQIDYKARIEKVYGSDNGIKAMNFKNGTK